MMNTYIATEGAEVAGSYHQGLLDSKHVLFPIRQYNAECSTGEPIVAEKAWRCYNPDNLLFELFDMPPDKYRYDVPREHGPTKSEYMQLQNNFDSNRDGTPDGTRDGKHYYTDIKSRAGKIVNFYNQQDAALSAWEFNQLTKPDLGLFDGPIWRYEYSPVTCGGLLETCDISDIVADSFSEEPVPFTKSYLPYRESKPINKETADIIGHILVARTEAMGQINEAFGEIGSVAPLAFTNSNQDHSAQFHGYLSEVRQAGPVRMEFWEKLTGEEGMSLDSSDFSGLKRLSPSE